MQSLAELRHVPERVGLPRDRPTLVLIGGASQLSEADFDRVRELFVAALVPIAQKWQAVVVDGGTDAGVMRLMGQARAELGATFPLVGVCPIGLVTLPDQDASSKEVTFLEPHHTHFVLVPGDRWGDESIGLARVATEIAADAPSVTVLINGGEVTWEDAAANVDLGRSVIAIAGSGRTADILAAAIHGDTIEVRAKDLAETGLVRTIELSAGSSALAQIIEEIFSSRDSHMSSKNTPDDPPAKLDYNDQLKQDFGRMIDSLKVEELQKDYLKSRWLDQVVWMENRATDMRNWHRRLRLTTIVASAIVPILVTINFNQDPKLDKWLKVATVGLSAVVTVSSAIEVFYQFGDRWYSYRKSAELLKSQGWQFFQLSGSYRSYDTHSKALPVFTDQVEEIIQRDVELYVTEGMREQPQEQPQIEGQQER